MAPVRDKKWPIIPPKLSVLTIKFRRDRIVDSFIYAT